MGAVALVLPSPIQPSVRGAAPAGRGADRTLGKADADRDNGVRSFSGPACTRWVAGDRARGLSALRLARETAGGAQADVVRGPAAILS
jgi:hypothetical protein